MKSVLPIMLAAGVAVGSAIGLAPAAAADESGYLNELAPRLAYLNTDQLLSEGYRVCRYVSVGRPTADAIPMVVKDLNVTVAATMDIISASARELRC